MLAYHLGGDPPNPLLILIHRGGMLHHMWGPQWDDLAARYHIIAPGLVSLPGAGQWLNHEQPAAFTQAVIEFVNALPPQETTP
jgi:pimeloyl-ACP methyl ester carboxylesterase